MPPPSYPGRNSSKDVASRVWTAEDVTLPALQTGIDAVEQRLDEETDAPDFALIFNNALI